MKITKTILDLVVFDEHIGTPIVFQGSFSRLLRVESFDEGVVCYLLEDPAVEEQMQKDIERYNKFAEKATPEQLKQRVEPSLQQMGVTALVVRECEDFEAIDLDKWICVGRCGDILFLTPHDRRTFGDLFGGMFGGLF